MAPELVKEYDAVDERIDFVPCLDAVIQRNAPHSMLRIVDEPWSQAVAFILRAEEDIFGFVFGG